MTSQQPRGVSRERVYAAVKGFIGEHGYSPTIRELSEVTGLTSPSTIHLHLASLRDQGRIAYEPNRPRTLRLTEKDAA